ncbi:OPT protein, partial [Urocynchramus pylzowi]|nr:OPT protein [Urocynchramus pylzowi]
GRRMCPLGWLGVASLCLGTLWAVPAKERRKAEKPRAELSLYENLDLDNYDVTLDNYGDILDLSNYEELYDYGDLVPKIEVGTLAPRPKDPKALPELGETTAGTPKLQPQSGAGPVPPAPIPRQGASNCKFSCCTPASAPLCPTSCCRFPPWNNTKQYFSQQKLKRIDLSSNSISWADADAFRRLPGLQELLLPQNRLTALPELPRSLLRLDARLNRIASAGLRPEAFRDLKQLQFLHLSDNQLDFIPVPLPESLRSLHLQNNNIQTMHEDTFCDSQEQGQIRGALEDIRLDGNPINLSLFPNAFSCLPRLPTGRF